MIVRNDVPKPCSSRRFSCVGSVLGVGIACLWATLWASGAKSKQPHDTARQDNGDEVVTLLSDLVAIDATDPPGHETLAASYLKDVFDLEGIPSLLVESAPGRGNLIATLRGDGSMPPLCLIGHLDVVAADRKSWSSDPFRPTIREGYLYGRGALDDKAMVAVNAELLLTLKRQQVPLKRDVIFVADAGEEGTPQFGIDYLIAHQWDKLRCEYALNEGGVIRSVHGRVQYVGVATTEKVPYILRITASGTGGHGMMPRPDNPLVQVARAVVKLGDLRLPMRLSETTRAYFDELARISPPDEARLYRNLQDDRVQEELWRSHPQHNAMLRTTLAPTLFQSGIRRNALPTEASATLDLRALPDEDMEQLQETLYRVISDPFIKIEVTSIGRPPGIPTGLMTPVYAAMEHAQRTLFPDAVMLPMMLTGATDGAELRQKGVQVYGIDTIEEDSDTERMHGTDERVSVAGLQQFFAFLYSVVTEVSVAPNVAPTAKEPQKR